MREMGLGAGPACCRARNVARFRHQIDEIYCYCFEDIYVQKRVELARASQTQRSHPSTRLIGFELERDQSAGLISLRNGAQI